MMTYQVAMFLVLLVVVVKSCHLDEDRRHQRRPP